MVYLIGHPQLSMCHRQNNPIHILSFLQATWCIIRGSKDGAQHTLKSCNYPTLFGRFHRDRPGVGRECGALEVQRISSRWRQWEWDEEIGEVEVMNMNSCAQYQYALLAKAAPQAS